MVNHQIFDTPLPMRERKREQRAKISERQQSELDAAIPWTLPPELHLCSCVELIDKVEPGSVDLILTDPPYTKELMPAWDDLGRFAKHALRVGGMLFAEVGTILMKEAMSYLDASAPSLYWHPPLFIDNVETGYLPPKPAYVMVGWRIKLYLVFSKGNPTHYKKFGSDIIKSARKEKDLHPWQSSLSTVAPVIERICLPGKVVVDPFLGSGTTAVAAVQRGCRFIGCDIDPDALNTAKERLSDARLCGL